MTDYTVGIIGIGFVGDSMQWSFLKKGLHPNRLIQYDKYKKIGSFEETLDTEIVFLCLPTLFDPEKCKYDLTSLHEICEQLQKANYQGLIVVKSTVEPGTSQKLATQYNLNIIHNPEFLTARTAREDFHNQCHIVLGKTESTSSDIVESFYKSFYPDAKISICTSWESEAMKIFVNSFYAMKIQIFNEFYLLCQSQKADYNKIKSLMLENGWINSMHTNIPGPDGKLSYGGACFPKDTQALLHYMKELDSPHDVLEACVRERNIFRKD